MDKTRVLITGATGLLGRPLMSLFFRSYKFF